MQHVPVSVNICQLTSTEKPTKAITGKQSLGLSIPMRENNLTHHKTQTLIIIQRISRRYDDHFLSTLRACSSQRARPDDRDTCLCLLSADSYLDKWSDQVRGCSRRYQITMIFSTLISPSPLMSPKMWWLDWQVWDLSGIPSEFNKVFAKNILSYIVNSTSFERC